MTFEITARGEVLACAAPLEAGAPMGNKNAAKDKAAAQATFKARKATEKTEGMGDTKENHAAARDAHIDAALKHEDAEKTADPAGWAKYQHGTVAEAHRRQAADHNNLSANLKITMP